MEKMTIDRIAQAIVKEAGEDYISAEDWNKIRERVKSLSSDMVRIVFESGNGDGQSCIVARYGGSKYNHTVGLMIRNGIEFTVKPGVEDA